MHPCPSCAELVLDGSCTCPHCGERRPCRSRVLSPAALLLGLAVAGCPQEPELQADYTAAATEVDADGDGWFEDEDCDDEDASIHPDAPENPGDGVDSNCDGEDDT